jgi:hypothetical protein
MARALRAAVSRSGASRRVSSVNSKPESSASSSCKTAATSVLRRPRPAQPCKWPLSRTSTRDTGLVFPTAQPCTTIGIPATGRSPSGSSRYPNDGLRRVHRSSHHRVFLEAFRGLACSEAVYGHRRQRSKNGSRAKAAETTEREATTPSRSGKYIRPDVHQPTMQHFHSSGLLVPQRYTSHARALSGASGKSETVRMFDSRLEMIIDPIR